MSYVLVLFFACSVSFLFGFVTAAYLAAGRRRELSEQEALPAATPRFRSDAANASPA